MTQRSSNDQVVPLGEKAIIQGGLQLQRVFDLLAEKKKSQPKEMYQCQTVNCGYIYDPDRGEWKGKIKKKTAFNNIPDDWHCPVCGATKAAFKPLAGPESVLEENRGSATENNSETTTKDSAMKKYRCLICGYVYDPEAGNPANGVAPGTAWEDVSEDWTCPVCSADKEEFEEA